MKTIDFLENRIKNYLNWHWTEDYSLASECLEELKALIAERNRLREELDSLKNDLVIASMRY